MVFIWIVLVTFSVIVVSLEINENQIVSRMAIGDKAPRISSAIVHFENINVIHIGKQEQFTFTAHDFFKFICFNFRFKRVKKELFGYQERFSKMNIGFPL